MRVCDDAMTRRHDDVAIRQHDDTALWKSGEAIARRAVYTLSRFHDLSQMRFHGEIFPKQSLGETSATKMGLSGIRVSTLTGWVSQSFNCAEIAVYGCSHRVLSGAGTQHDGQRQRREAGSRNHRVRGALRGFPPSRQAMRPFRQAIWL